MSKPHPEIKKWLQDKRILIIDTSTSFIDTISRGIRGLGATPEQILTAKDFDRADIALKKEPHIIVSEYQIGNRYGLDLIAKQAEYCENSTQRIFFIITATATDSAVAEAAEEDVDSYLLKPFSMDVFLNTFQGVIAAKLKPTPYMLTVQEGQELLKQTRLEEAEAKFVEAINLSKTPALACYYVGLVSEMQKKWDQAIQYYQKGRETNPIHYKCLIGEFETHEKLGRRDDAYKILKIISENFPITPQRLGRVFKLAILSRNIEDVDKFYELYTKLDRRPPELVKVIEAGMFAYGKFLLKLNNKVDIAIDAFKKGISASGRDINYITKVIQEFIEVKNSSGSETFLRMYPPEKTTSKEFHLLDYKVAKLSQTRGELIEKGKKLIKDGFASSDTYFDVIKWFLLEGRTTSAEDIAFKACEAFPHERERFMSLFQK